MKATKAKRRRLEQGWTLRALSDKCAEEGVPATYSHLAQIERGHVVPGPRLRAVLARLLDLDVVDDFERKAS